MSMYLSSLSLLMSLGEALKEDTAMEKRMCDTFIDKATPSQCLE